MRISNVANLRQLFKLRPLAAPLVEEVVGGRCWSQLDTSFDLFCFRFGLQPSDLLDRVASLPEPQPEAEWEGKPLAVLLDRLTAEHRAFRDRDLPALRAALELDGLPAYPDRYVAGLMLQDFQAFARAFLIHMAEEEERLFPDALLADAVLRHPGLVIDPPGRPLRTSQPGTPDEVFARMVLDIREKVRFQTVSPASESRFRDIVGRFREFEERLKAHAALESGELGGRLVRMEKAVGTAAVTRGR